MDRILICLYVPAVQERFDLFVPRDMDIAALTVLLANGVSELCSGRYTPSQPGILTLQDPELLLNPRKTLSDYGVDDGAKLILF